MWSTLLLWKSIWMDVLWQADIRSRIYRVYYLFWAVWFSPRTLSYRKRPKLELHCDRQPGVHYTIHEKPSTRYICLVVRGLNGTCTWMRGTPSGKVVFNSSAQDLGSRNGQKSITTAPNLCSSTNEGSTSFPQPIRKWNSMSSPLHWLSISCKPVDEESVMSAILEFFVQNDKLGLPLKMKSKCRIVASKNLGSLQKQTCNGTLFLMANFWAYSKAQLSAR